jgi:mycoredoxin-dependent peroxiredoxin
MARRAPCKRQFTHKEQYMAVAVGQEAPDFVLKSHDGCTVRLSDFRGERNVVLAFFPLAWTPV